MKKGFITGRRKDFKSEEAYLEDVFNKNREMITEVYGANAKNKFINAVQSRKVVHGVNVKKAMNMIYRSQAFTPYQDVARENMLNVLKKNDLYNQFRDLTRDKQGRYTKVNIENIKWDRDQQMYVYDNREINGKEIGILLKNSPVRLTIISDMV